MEKLYIVTGAMGHLGNTVVNMLLQQGKRVRGLVLPNDSAVAYDDENLELIRGNVCDIDSLSPLFENADGRDLVVIHTAGIVSIATKQQKLLRDVNVNGTRNIVRQCLIHSVKKLVHVSSVHALPEKPGGSEIVEATHFDPRFVHGPYAQTKAEASQLVLSATAQGLNACVVMPSGIIGPGDYGHSHLTQLIVDYLRGSLTACVRGGYDFVDVRDVASGILSCVERGVSGECYILSGKFCKVEDLLCELHRITGKKQIKTVLPHWFACATAPFAEAYYKVLHQPPLYTPYSLYTLDTNASFSHCKAEEALGYSPRPLSSTLEDTTQWLLETGRVKKIKQAHKAPVRA